MISRVVNMGIPLALMACVPSLVSAENSSVIIAPEMFETAVPKMHKPCSQVVIEELPEQQALNAKVAMINPEFRCYLPSTFGAIQSVSKQEFHKTVLFVR